MSGLLRPPEPGRIASAGRCTSWNDSSLVSLVTLTELTHSRTQDDASWRTKYGPRVDLWARQETHILRTQGPKALETYVGSFQSDPGVRNWLDKGPDERVQLRMRFYAAKRPTITTSVVPLDMLLDHLPPETATVTPAERAQTLRDRVIGLQLRRRW